MESTETRESKVLLVSVKNVYGNQTIYPECKDSKLFCNLVGKKTLSKDNLNILRALGYVIEVNTPKL